jgi:hypothetical protein
MVQVLAKHVEQLVAALPDELRETAIRKYKWLCNSCGCHHEREVAAHSAEELRPRACPIECLIHANGRLQVQVKFQSCLSLEVAGRDPSWQAPALRASQELVENIGTVARAWAAIKCRL